ncbi:uncharacterized protein LOC131941271 isoform X2 [Physella acuta]|uniref:uncharacterized protein LOC131941271 isoform X2 n=1 Tax=Physella acuta TaxID=109671 RepID=UPI0027DD0CD2|nr:uncharacterized protein LOC131941271 isoform X2 [Physella acuta]
MTSNNPVQVLTVLTSACLNTSSFAPGDTAVSLLLPTILFSNNYIFSTPRTREVTPRHFISLVATEMVFAHICMDEQALPDRFVWHDVEGTNEWLVASSEVSEGSHVIRTDRHQTFGCYLYGVATSFGYMHSAGHKIASISEPCFKTPMVMGDGKDNDCDGRIDEEILNEIDDDLDTQFNEDVEPNYPIDGQWGIWKEWDCSPLCNDSRLSRYRVCDEPRPAYGGRLCDGTAKEFKNGTCRRKICPEECPAWSWGVDCLHTCQNCQSECNKTLGSCEVCHAGYKDPKNGCKRECSIYQYGINCAFSCIEKCNADCSDKITAQKLTFIPHLIVLLSVPLIIFIYKVLSRRKELADEEDYFAVY